jgi:hypothetical protein
MSRIVLTTGVERRGTYEKEALSTSAKAARRALSSDMPPPTSPLISLELLSSTLTILAAGDFRRLTCDRWEEGFRRLYSNSLRSFVCHSVCVSHFYNKEIIERSGTFVREPIMTFAMIGKSKFVNRLCFGFRAAKGICCSWPVSRFDFICSIYSFALSERSEQQTC